MSDKVNRKPRCNRDKARNLFLAIIKKKRPRKPEIREAKRFQLNEIRRNLAAIDTLIHSGAVLLELGSHLYRKLLVSSEVYRQQQEMYDDDSCRTANRIVNLAKPHVRPIVRGKAGKKTEFGAKIHLSMVDGFSFLDTVSWDAFNEGSHHSDYLVDP